MRQALEMALEAYLCREMPAGTVIGDPKWWVPKIANSIKEALAQPVSSHGNAEDLYIEMNKHLNCPHCGGSGHVDDVAQPEQEPVAWRWIPSEVWNEYVLSQSSERAKLADEHGLNPEPLYTTPPQRKPLTDEEERKACEEWCYSVGLMQKSHGIISINSQTETAWLAWKARAAHGIKE